MALSIIMWLEGCASRWLSHPCSPTAPLHSHHPCLPSSSPSYSLLESRHSGIRIQQYRTDRVSPPLISSLLPPIPRPALLLSKALNFTIITPWILDIYLANCQTYSIPCIAKLHATCTNPPYFRYTVTPYFPCD